MIGRLSAAFLLVATAVSALAQPPKPRPIRPRMEIVFEGWITEHEVRGARFLVRNLGKRPLYYYGYSVDSPIYRYEKKTAKGWEDCPLGWCGTGMAIRRLAPGRSFALDVHPPDDLRRTGFRLRLDVGFDRKELKHAVVSGLVRR